MIVKYSEGCFRLQGRTLSQFDIGKLLDEARVCELKRARICVHYDDNSPIQEMFVLLLRETYKGTYQYRTANSMYLLQGKMEIEFVSDKGIVMSTVLLDEDNQFVKIEAGVYHTPIILSEYVLLHEVHEGPFAPRQFMRMMEPRGG